MKYHALDFLACPRDKDFPLKLYQARLKESASTPERHYQCEQYCGYMEKDIAGAKPSLEVCESCAARSVEEGILSCARCGALYLIKNGIPKLILDELKSKEEIDILGGIRQLLGSTPQAAATEPLDPFALKGKTAEMMARNRAGRDERIATFTSRGHQFLKGVEFKAVSRCLDIRPNDMLLDDGAGCGLLSVSLSRRCRYVVATDFSFESLLAFKEFVYGLSTSYFTGYATFPEERICLVQADSCQLPFRPGFRFDRAISTQVVSHIPGAANRDSAIREVANHLKIGGVFVLTVGNESLPLRLARPITGTPREATLEGGKGVGYYYKFSKAEFRRLLESFFVVDRLVGLQTPAYYLLGIHGGIARLVEGAIQASPLSCQMGNILLARCRKRAE